MLGTAQGDAAKTGPEPRNTGLGKFLFFSFAANAAWANLAMFALNLLSWIQLAVLPSGHAAGAWDVKRWRWRYQVFSMAGKPVRGGRQTRLRFPATAPEAELVLDLNWRITRVHQHFGHGNLAA